MPTVPHVLAADVRGIDGRLLVVLADDVVSLWVIGRDMAQVQLDAAGVTALRDLLREIEGRLT